MKSTISVKHAGRHLTLSQRLESTCYCMSTDIFFLFFVGLHFLGNFHGPVGFRAGLAVTEFRAAAYCRLLCCWRMRMFVVVQWFDCLLRNDWAWDMVWFNFPASFNRAKELLSLLKESGCQLILTNKVSGFFQFFIYTYPLPLPHSPWHPTSRFWFASPSFYTTK